MKFLMMSDSYKGNLDSYEVGQCLKEGVLSVLPSADVEILPMADGGEGFTECIYGVLGGTRIELEVTYPKGNKGPVFYMITKDGSTAIMEVAQPCGITLYPKQERDPLNMTTYGLGEMLLDAKSRGVKKIIVGLGGSGTNDAGMGMLEAIGNSLKDFEDIEVIAACDVDNPLCGPHGATYVYGPQKGVKPDQLEALDKKLYDFSVKKGVSGDFPGAGAAGGIGYALQAFLHAKFMSGARLLIDLYDIKSRIDRDTVMFTGEGHTDAQSASGKVVFAVGEFAKEHGLIAFCVSGYYDSDCVDVLKKHGITEVFSTADRDVPKEESIKNARSYIKERAAKITASLQSYTHCHP